MTTQLSNAGEGDCLRDAHFNYIYMRLRHAPQYHDGLRQKRNYNRPLPTRRLRRPPYRSRSSARGFHRAGWKVRSVRLEAQDGLNVRSSARRNVPTSCFWNVLWNRPALQIESGITTKRFDPKARWRHPSSRASSFLFSLKLGHSPGFKCRSPSATHAFSPSSAKRGTSANKKSYCQLPAQPASRRSLR
jgi:hypothetical protein